MSSLNRYIKIGISASTLLFIGGCANRAEEVSSITESVETHKNELVTELNSLSQTESELQPAFETTLAEDEELSSLADGSSDVFSNIETRRTSLEIIEEKTSSLNDEYTALTEGDNEELPEDQVQALAESLEQTAGTLEEFTGHYSTTLDTQTQYFESLAQEDATYETLTGGIDTISAEDETTTQLLVELDGQLTALEENNQSLMSTVQEMTESN